MRVISCARISAGLEHLHDLIHNIEQQFIAGGVRGAIGVRERVIRALCQLLMGVEQIIRMAEARHLGDDLQPPLLAIGQ